MEDSKIVDLYWEHSENAIDETSKKYSRYCHYISFNILHNNEDAEECVNDTYIRVWNSMPTQRPNRLSTFLGRVENIWRILCSGGTAPIYIGYAALGRQL